MGRKQEIIPKGGLGTDHRGFWCQTRSLAFLLKQGTGQENGKAGKMFLSAGSIIAFEVYGGSPVKQEVNTEAAAVDQAKAEEA